MLGVHAPKACEGLASVEAEPGPGLTLFCKAIDSVISVGVLALLLSSLGRGIGRSGTEETGSYGTDVDTVAEAITASRIGASAVELEAVLLAWLTIAARPRETDRVRDLVLRGAVIETLELLLRPTASLVMSVERADCEVQWGLCRDYLSLVACCFD